MSVKKDLDNTNLSALGDDEIDAIFEAAKTKVLETFGGLVPGQRDLPRGVRKRPSGKFESEIKWRGKMRYIGSFDTPERASAAYMSVKKELANIKTLPCGADEEDILSAIFDEAKKKTLEAVRAMPVENGSSKSQALSLN